MLGNDHVTTRRVPRPRVEALAFDRPHTALAGRWRLFFDERRDGRRVEFVLLVF